MVKSGLAVDGLCVNCVLAQRTSLSKCSYPAKTKIEPAKYWNLTSVKMRMVSLSLPGKKKNTSFRFMGRNLYAHVADEPE